jgi:HTH-like domain
MALWGRGSDGPVAVAVFIAAQSARYGIPYAVGCRALGVSQSWFYKWRHGDTSTRRARQQQLGAEIRRLFERRRGRYGSPRITADLVEAGWKVSENTVAGLMRQLGLTARPGKKRKSTTRPDAGRWRAPDLVRRSGHPVDLAVQRCCAHQLQPAGDLIGDQGTGFVGVRPPRFGEITQDVQVDAGLDQHAVVVAVEQGRMVVITTPSRTGKLHRRCRTRNVGEPDRSSGSAGSVGLVRGALPDLLARRCTVVPP